MDLTQVEFDGEKRKLVFHGNCLAIGAVCKAMCCREWVVGITSAEYATGQYDVETICELTEKACRDVSQPCLSRRYQLSKRDDRSCVYLQDNRCIIYDKRPNVCREFQCQGGWRFNSVLPLNNASPDQKSSTLNQATFTSKLSEDTIFVLHPLIKLNTVFYLKPRREIIFVKEMVGGCGKFNTRDNFDYPQLDDAQILMLVELFNHKETLRQVYARFCSQSASVLTLREFFEVVWVLNKHNIALDSRNFQGMLSGMGGIG